MPSDTSYTVSRIKGRYIVLFWLLPSFYFFGVADILNGALIDEPWYWRDIGFIYFYHATFLAAIIGLGLYSKLDWKALLGKKPNIPDFIPAFKLTVFIYIFSIVAVYALFIPLSYFTPDFVQWWYIDLPPLIYFDSNSYPFLPNLLNFLSLVVLAPIVEEVAFRGMLLHRWTHKWGMTKAILFSSLIFGVVHPDPIGAMAFGIAMCIIYLRTQSLVIPILCHGLTNLAVWLETLGYINIAGLDSIYSYTLNDLQSEWHIGVIFGTLSLVWAIIFLNAYQSKLAWKLPKL
jgi:membrane protease YdiL (CAAX protease family)